MMLVSSDGQVGRILNWESWTFTFLLTEWFFFSFLKVRWSQNEFVKSSIFQITNSKIWRISALKVWPDYFAYTYLVCHVHSKVLSFNNFFRAEILQIFESVIWKIDDFINSFWLYLTFNLTFNQCFYFFFIKQLFWLTKQPKDAM